MIAGTKVVNWILPEDQHISVKTIENIFKKNLNDYPRLGDMDVGVITTIALVEQKVLIHKKGH